jgi:CheY-like chemotaxis protein
VLLDLLMPEMDGVTFLTMLRRSALWKDVPVVVLTGVTDDDKLVSRAWELGVKDVIRKASFEFEGLLRVVKRHLGERTKD